MSYLFSKGFLAPDAGLAAGEPATRPNIGPNIRRRFHCIVPVLTGD
jgi:hypothetical protein